MGEFLLDYGIFLAKAVTIVVAVGAILMLIAGLSRRGAAPPGLQVEKLNDRYRRLGNVLQRAVLSKAAWKKHAKEEKKQEKNRQKDSAKETGSRKRMFVLDFKGDIKASGVSHLREEISAVLSTASAEDEVVLRLENAGGAVHEHGFAASQLLRVKRRGIPLTVIVDKVAASGGYLMACIADRIIAAPFAIVGSIGVLAQIPNFNRALEARGVDFEQLTAGKYKRTVTMFGKNTDEDRAKLKQELEEVHDLFKAVVTEHRPQLDIEAVATGEHWYGSRALELGLLDQLGTSDDYLLASVGDADMFHVSFKGKLSLQERVLSAMESGLSRLGEWFAEAQSRVGLR